MSVRIRLVARWYESRSRRAAYRYHYFKAKAEKAWARLSRKPYGDSD